MDELNFNQFVKFNLSITNTKYILIKISSYSKYLSIN